MQVFNIFKSRVILVNLLTFVLAVLAALLGSDLISANPELTATITGIIAAINILLRMLSPTAPITSNRSFFTE